MELTAGITQMQKLLAAMQQHKEVQSLEKLSTTGLHTEREANILSVNVSTSLSLMLFLAGIAESLQSEHSECNSRRSKCTAE